MAVFPMCCLDNRDLDCYAAEMAKMPEKDREKYLVRLLRWAIYRQEQVNYLRAKAKEYANEELSTHSHAEPATPQEPEK